MTTETPLSQPTLSILIPTYNRAEYLAEALASLCTVTVPCEIVVVDNASSDATAERLAAWQEREPRLRVVRQEQNVGGLANFNRALHEARGRYLCLLGDDDLSLPGNFEQKVALLEAHAEIGLVYSLAYRIDGEGRRHDPIRWPGVTAYSYVGGRHEGLDLLTHCYMQLQTVVFRRELWEKHGGFDDTVDLGTGTDWDMLIRYCRATETAFIHAPLVGVRFHGGSASSGFRQAGAFSFGRLATWRKWLLGAEPLVLDERQWQAMRESFRRDLDYDLGYEAARIAAHLTSFDQLRRDNQALHEQRLAVTTPLPSQPQPAGSAPAMTVCSCWRCRLRRWFLHGRHRRHDGAPA